MEEPPLTLSIMESPLVEGLEESQPFFSECEDIEEDSQLEVDESGDSDISSDDDEYCDLQILYEANKVYYMYVECRPYAYPPLIKIYGVNGIKDPKGLISEYAETRGNYSLLRCNHTPSSASLNVGNFFSFVLRTQAQVWMERRMFQEPVLLHQTERS
jgi:hypothetical protein